jgi:cyclomaltodextrinase
MHPLVARTIRHLFTISCCALPLHAHGGRAQPPGQPPTHVQVTPISPEIGLFDVLVIGLEPQASAKCHIHAQIAQTRTQEIVHSAPMVRAGNGTTAIARILLPPQGPTAALAVSVSVVSHGQRRHTAPVPFDLDIPEIERVPAWALGATWYQIFPERFRNGDPFNDPHGPAVTTVPWTSDFSDVRIEEIERAWSRQRAGDPRSRSNWNNKGGARRATIYSRRYGGDLVGVTQAADHIQSLGVNALYLCPVFQSSSLHKYDAADFLHVDPTFGPASPLPRVPSTGPDLAWTGADRYLLDQLLPAFRARSMRVILDGVWNHTGTDHWAFRDLIERGRESPYADWYHPRFNEAGSLVGWQAWDATNGNLPEFRQTDEGDLNPGVAAHVFTITRRWMDPNADGDPSDGIDGWRLDVAPEVGMAFWEKWRRHVRAINSDAALFGEIWFDAGPWFGGRAFDAQMNYPFAVAVIEWCAGSPRTSGTRLGELLGRVFSHAPQNDLAQMNLLASHDTTRVLTMLARPDATYDDGATSADLGRKSLTSPPSPESLARAELAIAIQALWIGSPMIFAGDEFGVFGPDDPDNRRPVPWPDAGEMESPADAPNLAMLDAYRRWFTLRSRPDLGDTLRYGTASLLPTNNPDALAFVRALNGHRVALVVNRAPITFDASPFLPASMRDSMDSRVPPLSARWYAWNASGIE